MTQLLTRSGQQAPSFAAWSQSQAYSFGDCVIYDNAIYKANVDIAANTPWDTDYNFTKVVNGNTEPLRVMISDAINGGGFGRLHAYGNRIFRAGSNAADRIYGYGMTNQTGTSTELFSADTLPDSWVKIQDTPGNFYGLGSDGYLYVAGDNTYGQLGDGTPSRGYIAINKNAKLYGSGITVLNFWATENCVNPDNEVATVLVSVNDNGTIKSYTFGYNVYGATGNGTTTNQTTPYEVASLANKTITTAYVDESSIMVVTTTGEVWCSGYNTFGNLGLGVNTTSITTFQQAKTGVGAPVAGAVAVQTAFCAGNGLTGYILLANGGVLASGYGNWGMKGDGVTTNTNYFAPVKTNSTTSLTGITKIYAHYNSLLAFNGTTGDVYFAGANWDGHWGTGETNSGPPTAVYATVKQSGMKDVWMTGGPRGNSAIFYLDTDNVLWAAGYNADGQLGVKNSAIDTIVMNKEKVILPAGEYPVAIRMLGSTTATGIWLGTMLLSNTNKLYAWGAPGGNFSPYYDLDWPRWPVQIKDFYYDIQTQ